MAYMRDLSGRRLDTFLVEPRRTQTAVVYGDSLTEQGGEIAGTLDTRAFAAWTWANVELGQALTIAANLGVGGDDTTEILARIGDVIDLDPGWVIITAGTNNAGVAGGVATAQADLTEMFDTFDAAGIRVCILTLPPRTGGSWAGTQKADTLAINEWLRQQSRTRPGLVVADIWPALATAASSNFLSTLYGFNPTSDGVHLSATGAYAAGKVLAAALRPHLASFVVPYSDINPGANLAPNPRPGQGAGGAATPTSWTLSGSGTTFSDVARTDGLGTWKQVVCATGGATVSLSTNAGIGALLAVGDTVNGILEFEVESMDQAAAGNAQGISLSLRAWNGSSYTDFKYAFNAFSGPNVARSGVLRVPDFTVPSGTTIVSLFIELRGTMTFRFDRAGIYKRGVYSV